MPAPRPSKTGVRSDVNPPSTSAAPMLPPTGPLPVTKHRVPVGVWSSSGCAAVATGSALIHWPDVAVSPRPPISHAPSDSHASSATFCVPVATTAACSPAGSS